MATYTLGKIIQEVLDTGSELTLIARDSKHSHGPSVRVGACGSQVISEVLTKAQLTVHHWVCGPT